MPRKSASSSSSFLLSAAFAAFLFFSMLSASSASRPLAEAEVSCCYFLGEMIGENSSSRSSFLFSAPSLAPSLDPLPLNLSLSPLSKNKKQPAVTNSRALKQYNSTQKTGPWFPITGTTASAMPGYFPRLNLTRNATASQVTLSSLPLTTASSFPGQSIFPPAAIRSGNSGLQSGGLSGVENFDGTPIVETTAYSN